MQFPRKIFSGGALVLLTAAVVMTGCGSGGSKETGAIDTAKIAEEAFIYGYPMVMNYGVLYEFNVDKSSSQYKGPFNTIFNEARVFTPKDTAVVTPNSDTPYSFLTMDLRSEPRVICVPAVEKSRYYSVQLVDMYTFNFAYIGSRSTGNAAGCYMVAGPGYKGEAPAGIAKTFRSETEYSVAIFRAQLFNPGDMPNVVKVQAGYQVQPLSQFLKQPAPAAAPNVDWLKFDKEEAKKNFFAYLNYVLQFCPEAEEEKELRARFARIGIAPGKPFDFEKLSAEDKVAFGAGMKLGLEKITKQKDILGKEVNGWRVGSAFGDRSYFKGDWLKRAAAAMAGIYGNSVEEAMYPMATTDGTGGKLDGSTGNYTLTFPAGQYPPVNAFWSVTMYDGKTQLLIENPINRYLINSPMLPQLKKNPDGSLMIHIQKDSPGKAKESNWLPAPDGPIYLVMRLYWPKQEALDGKWQPPAIQKVAR